VIRSFKDKDTENLYLGSPGRAIPSDVAKGSQVGQHSIRVNEQWRICFIWKEGDAFDVEFCDYH
jgi:plasmid maintenance system killer protein